MTADITSYLNLITSEHRDKPNFIATVSAAVQPVADLIETVKAFNQYYDLDVAVGQQLDVCGEWIGRTRFLTIPLVGVYFSLDTVGVGLDEGTWLGPFDPTSGLVALPDDAYRTYLRAVIQANKWDGTIPGAYLAWDALFAGTGFDVIIQDNQDMTMDYGLIGPAPNAVTLALFTGGYLSLKPDGVRVNFLEPSVPSTPFFGLDVENLDIAGLDVGSWSTILGSA